VAFTSSTGSMTLTVIEPNDGDEAALQEQGIARAKDFALQLQPTNPRQRLGRRRGREPRSH
jgi:hypothetical protein